MIKEFKAFVLRGNVVDLAIAVVIGAAFGAVVQALVKDLITPLIGIPGKADFANLTFTINGSVFRYGDFINVVIAFVSVAAAVFFLVVKPMNRLRGVKPDGAADMRECPECLTSIPVAARRCAACTVEVAPAS
jgi:large conductance mechanosensitive channel